MGELLDGNPLFPGESETDQIMVINSMLGNFPASMKQALEKKGTKLKDSNNRNTLEKR